ncbi:MAG: HmuY family protein [Candidatus Marinimicrobia bacterium]|nr:HmuY family protein [Candidatus Neomarinimicrobiota bacterium]MBL7109391.1 HmuY family protein [Candidatus Neomarinimicrobiota bacterium]
MKKIITMLITAILVIVGCEDNIVNSDNEVKIVNNDSEVNTFVSVNVKDGLTDHFSFETNTGDTSGTSAWDIAFTALKWSPAPGAPDVWDPFITANEDISVVRVNVDGLSDIVDIPESELFTTNFSTFEDGWYETDDNHIVNPLDYVYIVNTEDGKYPAFEVVNYYDDEGNSGVFTIEWKYLAE